MDARDMDPAAESGIARRLREERPELGALQLDAMKTRVMASARVPRSKGATLRGRIVVALLALGLMGAGAGGVVAGGGDTSPGQQSGTSQYQPAKCKTDKAGNVKGCNCPDHSNLVFTGGSFQCQCPDGSSFDSKGNKCGCPDGMKFDDKTDSCVVKDHHGEPCHDHCAAGEDNSSCHDHCFDANDPACHDHCTGNPPGCHDHCDDPGEHHASAGSAVYARMTFRTRRLRV